jgi:hypothetical protein
MKHDKDCELLGGYHGCSCERRQKIKKFPSKLKEAMQKDYYQLLTDSLTPDRGYAFPTDNVMKLIEEYFNFK